MAVTDSANSVEQFIKTLSLPEREAKGVLHCDEDCKSFYIGFYGRNLYAIDDLLDYREDRIEKSEITLDNFLEMCYNGDMLEVFTKTFYQSFTLDDIEIVIKAVASGEITLEKLFGDFKKNPNKNILQNIL